MHEIVTLQFGQRANYVGTHFWNIQESYFTYSPADAPSIVDHDINFRPGIGADGSDTYTPRALIYDFKAGFGSLRKVNALYEVEIPEVDDSIWHGERKTQTAPLIEPSAYQAALEAGLSTPQIQSSDVRYWSDYNRVYYHPKSLIQLSAQSLTSQISASESFLAGADLWRDVDQEIGGLLDHDVRFFAEECDGLQGFQVFGSCDDAWGGFMSKYIEALEDDYGKKSIWVWSLENDQGHSRMQQLNRITNSTQSLVRLYDHASANIRISSIPSKVPSYINLEPTSLWNTSALSALAIESATLPLRLRQGTSRGSRMAFMDDLLHGQDHRKIWNLLARAQPADNDNLTGGTTAGHPTNGTIVSDSRVQNGSLRSRHDNGNGDSYSEESNLDIDFTPGLPQPHTVFPSLQSTRHPEGSQYHTFGYVESRRNAEISFRHTATPGADHRREDRSYDEETSTEMFDTPLALPLLDSCPRSIFSFPASPSFAMDNAAATDVNRRRTQPNGIAMDTALSTRSGTKTDILTMRDLVVGRAGRAMNLVDSDEREALYDGLTKMAEAYTYGYEDDFSAEEEQDD